MPCGKEQIITMVKNAHGVENISLDFANKSVTQLGDVSCKMTETVQSSGAAAIPDGTIVHDVADHEMQEERWDYIVSKNLQTKYI